MLQAEMNDDSRREGMFVSDFWNHSTQSAHLVQDTSTGSWAGCQESTASLGQSSKETNKGTLRAVSVCDEVATLQILVLCTMTFNPLNGRLLDR